MSFHKVFVKQEAEYDPDHATVTIKEEPVFAYYNAGAPQSEVEGRVGEGLIYTNSYLINHSYESGYNEHFEPIEHIQSSEYSTENLCDPTPLPRKLYTNVKEEKSAPDEPVEHDLVTAMRHEIKRKIENAKNMPNPSTSSTYDSSIAKTAIFTEKYQQIRKIPWKKPATNSIKPRRKILPSPFLLEPNIQGRGHKRRRIYECVYCHASFVGWNLLQSHIGNDTNFGSPNCLFCTRTFPTYRCCVHHMNNYHLANNPIDCGEGMCSERFHTIAEWDTHMRQVHSIYMCNRCGERFMYSSRLKNHRKTHRPEYMDTSSRTCLQCDKVFGSVSNLQEHYIARHTVSRVKCGECDREFLNESRLYRHRVRYHSKRKAFVCPGCGMEKKRSWEMKQHVALRHNADNPFCCTVCNYRYPTSADLVRHCQKCSPEQLPPVEPPKTIRRHFNYAQHLPAVAELQKTIVKNDPFATFECVYCHVPQKNLHLLNKHLQCDDMNTNVKIVSCVLCNVMLPSIFCLKSHISANHKDVEKCPICAMNLATHKKIGYHFEARHALIECAICDQVIQGTSNWKHHVEEHTSHKRFCCDKCPSSFGLAFHLVRHGVKRHGSAQCSKCGVCVTSSNLTDHINQRCRRKRQPREPNEPNGRSSSPIRNHRGKYATTHEHTQPQLNERSLNDQGSPKNPSFDADMAGNYDSDDDDIGLGVMEFTIDNIKLEV